MPDRLECTANRLAALLRRAALMPYSFPSDGELLRAADQVFQALDRCEAREKMPRCK